MKYNFCRSSVAEIQKYGVKICKYARKYRSAGWSPFIKGAGEARRRSLSFAGKCRLVRRRGERAAENAANTQIRLKYEYKYTKYTQKDKKYTNTKIQTHTNTNFTVGSLSRIGGVGKWDFFWKILLTKTAVSSVLEKFRKVPAWQNDRISQGKIPPSKVESLKNLFRGVKVVRSIKKLGADDPHHHPPRSSLDSQKFKPNLNAHFSFFWPPLFSIISQMKRLYLAEEKNSKCLGRFSGIHGDCGTSFREEFLPNPHQTNELFFSVICYMIVIPFLLPASTISWTRWWPNKVLWKSKNGVFMQCNILAKFQKKWSPPPAANSRKRRKEGKEIQMQIEIQICTTYLYLYLCIYCLSMCICIRICISGVSVQHQHLTSKM